MANRKIQVDFLANPEGFKKGTSEVTQSASWLEKALARLGPVGNALQGTLNRVGLSSVSMGAGITGGAVVALAAAYEVGKKAVDQYVELGHRVREYSIITGQSAEESSKQVQAFEVLGVSEETAAASVVKLSKAIETTPKRLEALGIEIARNAAGNVDLGQTLLNVVSAYQATNDAAKKNEIALAAFGKAGATMIPVLEANAGELKRLEDAVSKVYTAEDLKRVHDYEISQKELKRSTDELGLNLGQALLPAWKANIDSINENIYVNKHLDDQLQKMGKTHSQNRADILRAGQALREEYHAAQDAQTQADTLAASQQAAANAALAEAEAEDKLYDAIHKSTSAEFAYEQANIDLQKAKAAVAAESLDDAAKARKIADAQANLTHQIRLHGRRSREAADADIALRKAEEDAGASGVQAAEDNLRLREAYVKVADSAVALAEEQAAVNGVTLTATEKADIYRKTLEDLAAGLDPGSPLRKQLQAYIDELNSIPAEKSTTVHLYTSTEEAHRAAGGHGTLEFDEGGVVPGLPGQAVPATVHGGEVILNQDQQRALRSSGGGAKVEQHIHINIDRGAFIDGPSVDRLANLIAQRLSYVTGR